MYTDTNFKTKKALREAVARGDQVTVYQPGPFPAQTNGDVAVEGPHHPQPHTWYACVRIKEGVIVKVLSVFILLLALSAPALARDSAGEVEDWPTPILVPARWDTLLT